MSTKPPFRLIKYASCNAAENMAIDEAILEAHLEGLVPPTLRIYQFAPPAVSFGYAQRVDNRLCEKIKQENLDVVRRPTGGRAVLHLGDLTYAFVCSSKAATIPEYALVEESIASAYRRICQALILGLDFLGAAVSLGQKNGRYQDKHDCFQSLTNADLQYQDKKIAGSAQLRRRHAVLQHGSIILNQPQSLLPRLLSYGHSIDDIEVEPFPENDIHHANLFEILGSDYSLTDLEKALRHGFELTFENQFLTLPLTDLEEELASNLVTKYAAVDKPIIDNVL